MRGTIALTCLLAASAVLAQTAGLVLRVPTDVGALISGATRDVRFVAPGVRSLEVAEGLRRAAVEREVRVRLLVDARDLGRGRIAALSRLKASGHALEVRVLRGITDASVLVDGARLVRGPLVFEVAGPGLKTTTFEQLDPARAAQERAAFDANWRRARPWMFEIGPPKFTR